MDITARAPVREGDLLANKYRVEQVLGVGGMGIVVAARHIDLDQRVALKFLLPTAMESDEMIGRFIHEGRAVVKMKSEHVAKVLDVGRLEDGAPYIVMELLHGQDLGVVIRERGTLEVEEAASFVLQACEAVAEAHASKIIHRDLKPQNLFLTEGLDGQPLIKVLDFGISKTLNQKVTPGGDPMTLTRTQSMLGSPLYMSPEQMRSSKSVDERSDIWSFGVILFELLTGQTPFTADTVPELVFKLAEGNAPNVRDIRPSIPAELAYVIARCLKKDVDQRYASIAELAAGLEPFAALRDRPLALRVSAVLGTGSRPRAMSVPDLVVRTQPATATSDGWGSTHEYVRPKRRRNMIVIGAVGAVVALIVSVGVGVRAMRGTPQADGLAAGGLVGVASSSPSAASPSGTALPTSAPNGNAPNDDGTSSGGKAAVLPPGVAAVSSPEPSASTARGQHPKTSGAASAKSAPPVSGPTSASLSAPPPSSVAPKPTPSTGAAGGFIPVRE